METKVDSLASQVDQKLQQEFNQWAAAELGDEMEDHHSDITKQTLALMEIQPGVRESCINDQVARGVPRRARQTGRCHF
jgi:hypothetical protein